MERFPARRLLGSCIALILAVSRAPGQDPRSFSVLGKSERPLPAPAGPLYDGPQPFDMLAYVLNIRPAMESDGLEGRCLMTMRLKSSVDSLVLNALGLSLDTVSVDGVPKSFTVDSTSESFMIHLNGTRLVGDTLRILIPYRRTPGYPRLTSREGYYFFRDTIGLPANLGYTFSEPSDARLWFPCYDQPWEKATSEIFVTVPGGYVAASNGRWMGTTVNGDGTVTWHWREDHPIATYLMCATVSRFAISTLPYVSVSGDTIPVQYFTWAADSGAASAFLPVVHQMLLTDERLFGTYPFDKYAMSSIVPFVYLGMEHQTMTTLNRYVQTDPRVVSHELAHQWWGDLVTCGTWADVWLNEGFATYAEALWRESTGGSSALKSYMQDTLNGFQYGSWQGAVYDPVGQGFNLFDQVVYSKGAWVLHTLRGVLGDSVFFRCLGAYRERFAGRSAVSGELQSVIDSVAGRNMEWFFNEWIYGPGWPEYASRTSWDQETLTLIIFQRQSLAWPTYRMPIQVSVFSGQSGTTTTVWDSMRTQSFRLPCPSIPDSVVLDREGWILKRIVPPPDAVTGGPRPVSFVLSQNYPNPFNPATTIRYSLPATDAAGSGTRVKLKVYDLLGRDIATLVDGVLTPGEHVVTFDGSHVASGVYLYRLDAGASRLNRKMVLVR